MSLANYGDLKTSVAKYLVRDDLVGDIDDLIRLGEARLHTDLRLRFMETNANVTVVSATREGALPTRYLEGRSLYISGSPNVRLEWRSPVEYWELWADKTAAKPEVFTIEGENFLWGPVPDTGYTAVLLYYQQPTVLSADADTNGLFTLAPNMYVYAALIEAAPYLGNDARVPIWTALYEDMKDRLHLADGRDRYSGDIRLATRETQRT